MKKSLILSLLFAALLSIGWIKQTDTSDLLFYRDAKGQQKPVKSPADWQLKRQQIISGLEQVMGKLPSRAKLPALDVKFRDSLKADNYTRYTISFTIAANETQPAYLYVPHQKGKKKKLAAMMVLHGTGDLGKELVDGRSPKTNRAQAKELAQRGYVVIAPDYPSFGELKDYDFAKDRYESGTMRAIFSHMRCVDLLQARPDVDPERIGVVGHSLGGHNAMFVGAFDKRLKVIVSSSGWTPLAYYNIGEEGSKRYGGRLGPWAQDRYMPYVRDKFSLDDKKLPFDFPDIIAALAPRAFFSNSPINDTNFDVKGVKAGMAEAAQVYNFLKAPQNLQVRYPEAGHDFPTQVRTEAYEFIDKILAHTPNPQKLE